MADLFQQEVILCAKSPLSLTNGFKKLQIRVHRVVKTRTEALATKSFVDNPDHVDLRLVKICHILSGLAGGSACVAIPYNATTIYVICEDNWKIAVQQAIKKLAESLQVSLDETDDDALSGGILLQRAIHFGLLSALFLRGWIALEKNLLLRSNLACYQDSQPVEALSLEVHFNSDSQILLLVSPDVLHFRRFKITAVLPEPLCQQLEDGCEINLQDLLWQQTEETIHKFQCCVLPSMMEGYVVGCRKSPPNNAHSQEDLELLLYKHGLVFPENGTYLRVCSTLQATKEAVWFPSCCVLTRAGLMALPPSSRASRIASVLEHFTADAAVWNFFTRGGLYFKVISSHGLAASRTTGWITAREALTPVSGVEDLQTLISPHNFRRPKPLLLKPTLGRESIVQCDEEIPSSAILGKLQSFTSTGNPQAPQNLKAVIQSPFFPKRNNGSRDVMVPESSMIGSMGTLKKTTLQVTKLNMCHPKATEERETKFSKVALSKALIIPTSAIAPDATRNLDLVSKMKAPTPGVVLPMSIEHQHLANPSNNQVPTVKKCTPRKEKIPPKVAGSVNVKGPVTLIAEIGRGEILCDPLTSTERQIKTSQDVYHPTVEANPILHASQKTSRGPRATAADLDPSANNIKVLCKHAEGKLMDLTVNELKCFLISRNMKASFRKKEDFMKNVQQLLTQSLF